MKSIALVALGGFTSMVAASQDAFQSGWYGESPAKTVTVTGTCAPGQPGATGAPGNTINIAEMALPVAVEQSATAGGSGIGSDSPESTETTTASSPSKTFHVDVGTFKGKVQFVPNQLEAEIGDVVIYNFLAKSHSLTESNFATPCTYNGGFDTGLNQSNPQNISGLFEIPFEVKTKSPQWFYCKQPGPPRHCGLGMVFGLNPAGKMDQFVQNAIAQNGNQTLSTTTTTTTSAPTATTLITSTSATTTTPVTTTISSPNGITTVTVGLDNGKTLVFSPPFIAHAPVGTRIHFDFRAKNHTLTESSFDAPCSKLPGATVDTDFNNVNPDDVPNFRPFDFTVASEAPRFFYCKQANGTPNGHCGKGMVFGLNVDEATFGTFVGNAKKMALRIKGREVV
ncbi:hypothetical protein MMC24_005989 [Lignoscripta atroalba]|nr:hypothetical protein [Lignoscripta atroalba]